MKKTLIALLALGGLAMAAEKTITIDATTGTDFNTDWVTTLQQSGWQMGDEYSLSFAVTGGLGNGQFMKLADNSWLVSQTSGGPFFGVNTAGNHEVTKSDWTFSKLTDPIEVRVLTAGEQPLAGWSQNANGSASAKRDWGGLLMVEIDYRKDAGTTVQYSYYEDALLDQFVMPTTSFDLEKFVMNTGTQLSGWGQLNVNHSEVPEPTTGALSLLALAGLCIRRRK